MESKPEYPQPISRVTRSRQAARAAYDRLSRWYDWFSGSEEAFNRRALDMLDPRPGERVLEVGCGTGHTIAALAARGCRAYGVDLSLGMARAARSRLRRKKLLADTCLGLADAARLPYAPACFDLAFCAFTLELFDTPEISAVLNEMRRVLRPGGRVGVVALSLPERPGGMVRVYEWFHRALPAVVDCRPIPTAWLLRQNGFQVRQMECQNMWGLPVDMVVGENCFPNNQAPNHE